MPAWDMITAATLAAGRDIDEGEPWDMTPRSRISRSRKSRQETEEEERRRDIQPAEAIRRGGAVT
jgi:hypothetical protein